MDIKNLRQILKLCRSEGVTEITVEGTNIKFGEKPRRARASSIDEYDRVPMTMDELISSQLDMDG